MTRTRLAKPALTHSTCIPSSMSGSYRSATAAVSWASGVAKSQFSPNACQALVIPDPLGVDHTYGVFTSSMKVVASNSVAMRALRWTNITKLECSIFSIMQVVTSTNCGWTIAFSNTRVNHCEGLAERVRNRGGYACKLYIVPSVCNDELNTVTSRKCMGQAVRNPHIIQSYCGVLETVLWKSVCSVV